MAGYDFDLFVIGAGSGGVRAARIAAGHGARVAVAEEFRYGGTCVIRGCVPKKLLAYAGRFHGEFEDAAGFGWTLGEPTHDWPRLIAAKDKEIARLEGIYRRNLESRGVATIPSRAVVEDAHTVRTLADGRTITAKVILIATGAAPFLPEFPGREHVISSNEALDLPARPERVIVVGGSYIAVEFASIFNGLGSQVTLVYRRAKILRGFDEDLRDGLMQAMRGRGVEILTDTEITRVAPSGARTGTKGTRLAVSLTGGREIGADQVMYATGRHPNTAGLGLEKAGVRLGSKGEVLVDAGSRSSVPSIYAVGDVTDRINLTPVAIREGHAFADSVFGRKPWTVDHGLVATAVFSEPEIGTVGLPEAAAREKFPSLVVFKAAFRPMKYTLSGRDERMLMKLLVDGATDKVVGCHVLGPDAAEIVQMAGIALQMGATKADFDRTIALHPSAAEELVTMREPWVPPKPAA